MSTTGSNVRRRAGAGLTLLGFVAVLLLGAFHPLGLAHGGHDCGGDGSHLCTSESDHHDAQACALCHLARDVHGDVTLPHSAVGALTPAARAVPPPSTLRPGSLASPAFRSRAPPAA